MIARILDTAFRRWLDLVLGALALAVAAPSLAYPLGRDQALPLFVAREWLSGRAPYKDAWDQLPPGLYLLNMVENALFGGGATAVRWADLVLILVLGGVCARLAKRLRTPRSALTEHMP